MRIFDVGRRCAFPTYDYGGTCLFMEEFIFFVFGVSGTFALFLSFIFINSYLVSKDEFNLRNEWIVKKNNKIDWKNVDAGRFLFFVLVRLIVLDVVVFLISYALIKYL